MRISNKYRLYFSLIIIVVYWCYQLASVDTDQLQPQTFTDLAIRIAGIKLIHVTAIVILLYLENASWREMGFHSTLWRKQIRSGLILGFLLFLFINVGLSSVLAGIFPKNGSSNSILHYFTEWKNLFIWMLIGIFGGGFVEELMRIFVLTRFEKGFGKTGLYIALLCSSILFGLGHLYQGQSAALSTGVSGLVMGIIYIRNRSALEVITIHAFSDVLAILAAYALAPH